MEDNNKK